MERSPHMETIQFVLDKDLLKATDRAAKLTQRNRSALIRDALREHLRALEIRSMEQRDRAGFARKPSMVEESTLWESVAVWPEK